MISVLVYNTPQTDRSIPSTVPFRDEISSTIAFPSWRSEAISTWETFFSVAFDTFDRHTSDHFGTQPVR